MKKILQNKKLAFGKDWLSIPRCYWSKRKKRQSAKVLVECGDCDNKVEIYYDEERHELGFIEINGVIATKKWWKELFTEIGLFDETK